MGVSPLKSRKKTRKWLKSVQKDTSQELKSQWKSKWKFGFKLLLIVIFYFSSSIALTFFQKDLILRLPFPLSIVIVHLVLKFLLSAICRFIWSKCQNETRVTLKWKEYLSKVAIVALVSGLDIGLSQWSLEYVTLSLYTMTKTTSTPFILFFGLLLNLEKKHWSQIVIVLLITLGLIMFTYKSTAFSFVGFIMVLSAAFFSGIRWTLSQLIMQKSKLGLENPIDFIFHIQPLMILTLLPIAIGVEGVGISASQDAFRFTEISTFLHTFSLMTIGGLLAFFMEVAEFLVVTFSSSLTLAIIGVFKEVTVLTLAVFRNGNQVSSVNVIGMVICLMGIFAHVLRKALKDQEIPKKVYEMSSSEEDERVFSPILPKEGLPLLEDESSESEIETTRQRLKSVNSDDIYFKENRTWTSVKDKHLKGVQDHDFTVHLEQENNHPIFNLSDEN